MESIRKRKKRWGGIEKKKQLRTTGSSLQGIVRALQEQKKQTDKTNPPRQCLIYIILIIIIIIIKVYENKRTPGNLGIKNNTPNPNAFSDVKSSVF